MVTMLSGAALMDGALFVLAANAKTPQAQDREHLLAAQMAGIKNIIVVQNKVDVVDRSRTEEHMKEIEQFLEGTIAEGAPVIPVSAQHGTNIDVLLYEMEKNIPTPPRNVSTGGRMFVLRSFDVNRPGTEGDDIIGGVVGGSIVTGVLRQGDEIEIKPGVGTKSGTKTLYEPLVTTVRSLNVTLGAVEEARSGGLVAVGTSLDPSLTKSDGLVGNVVGKTGSLPPVSEKVGVDVQLFERAVGTEELVVVDKIRTNEALVLNAGTTVTSGVVSSAREDIIEVNLRKPVCVEPGTRVAVSRRIGDSWRLIGYGSVRG
jgi:translation initiation factor 2 subunit 3